MAQDINDNYRLNAPKALENKSGRFTGGVWRPYLSVTEANQYVDPAYRHRTLIVWIAPDINTIPVAYWWPTNTTNAGLVPFDFPTGASPFKGMYVHGAKEADTFWLSNGALWRTKAAFTSSVAPTVNNTWWNMEIGPSGETFDHSTLVSRENLYEPDTEKIKPEHLDLKTVNLESLFGTGDISIDIADVSAESVASTENASVEVGGTPSARTFHFRIPRGQAGEAGGMFTNREGWLVDTVYNKNDYVFHRSTDDAAVNSMWITQTATSFTSALPPYQDPANWVEFEAPKGEDGLNATITAVTAEGIANGTAPSVSMGGSPNARTFHFRIPAGGKGDPGTPATITTVTAESVPSDASPSVVLGGTASARTMHFRIPAGIKGTDGEDGTDGTNATITSVTAESVPYGTAPSVQIGGTATERAFHFRIPLAQNGSSGTSATITLATSEMTAYGTQPLVVLGGTPLARTFHFRIPATQKALRFEDWVTGAWSVGDYAVNGNIIATPKVDIANSTVPPTTTNAFWRIVYNPSVGTGGGTPVEGEIWNGEEHFTGADLDPTTHSYTLTQIEQGWRYDVFIEGTKQRRSDYNIAYPVVTFLDSVPPDQRIWVEVFKLLSGNTTPPDGEPNDQQILASEVIAPSRVIAPDTIMM